MEELFAKLPALWSIQVGSMTYEFTAATVGLIVVMVCLLGLSAGYRSLKSRGDGSPLVILFDSMFEGVYGFFDQIMEGDVPRWVMSYILTLFFVILGANLLGVVIDLLSSVFPILKDYITSPTLTIEFVLAMSIVSIVLMLGLQMKHLGFGKFLHEYVPITGKGYLEAAPDAGALVRIGTKIGDIILSLFLGVLDIVGVFAKIVSLSFRLFGNMLSGAILGALIVSLGVAIAHGVGLGETRGGVIGLPLVTMAQGLLIGAIQAFVFALLVAIFIKLSVTDT